MDVKQLGHARFSETDRPVHSTYSAVMCMNDRQVVSIRSIFQQVRIWNKPLVLSSNVWAIIMGSVIVIRYFSLLSLYYCLITVLPRYCRKSVYLLFVIRQQHVSMEYSITRFNFIHFRLVKNTQVSYGIPPSS